MNELRTMECKNCKKEITYNYRYHCFECSCGKTYNAGGQELRPREDWQEEYDEEYY